MKIAHLSVLALLILTPACAGVAAGTQDVRALLQEVNVDVDAPLPAAKEALVLAQGGENRLSLMDGVQAFVRATGLNVALDASMRGLLEQTEIGLGGDLEVPPDQVYPFFEGLLQRHGVYVVPVHLGADEPTISLLNRRLHKDLDARYVDLSQERARAFCARHPATLVRTPAVANIDARAFTTSVRSLMRLPFDGVNAVGPRTLLLSGSGKQVQGLLLLVEAASQGAQSAPVAPVAPAEAPDEDR